ncbi:putative WD repeat-containing protein 11-like [Triplophysa rosa]|uniref:WD repeat-containing protein 11 n=1 Tax=Triplophysa rosa TaxID=992332 RepID=A0A9W7X2W6_TRIRA|nr:putative WD repeat-containing protein 11-like [Triplophysa rosa]
MGHSLISGIDPPRPSAGQQEVHLKFLLTGLLSGLPLPPFSLRMCPPLTTKNINHYQPLLAVGTSNGSVLVYNLTSGLLHKELSVHSCEVRGIEWVSLTSFLSFATSVPNNLGLVRNELQHVDLRTGRSFAFRGERGNDEPAIEMIKVSHLKQYLVVVFRDKPLELWDTPGETRRCDPEVPPMSLLLTQLFLLYLDYGSSSPRGSASAAPVIALAPVHADGLSRA